jgi:ADP-ribose pyrophosphatase YjhB (NUDIX family)
MAIKDSFCSYCGAKYASVAVYPRVCGVCNTTVWSNPIPVSVILVPIIDGTRQGLMVIRRGIEPRIGKLALLGGFLEDHESWQQGGAREVLEEAGLQIDSASVAPLWFSSTEPKPNRVLLFGVCAPLLRSTLPAFAANHETLERGVVFGPRGLPDVFAFPLHVQAAERFFAHQGTTADAPADYQSC